MGTSAKPKKHNTTATYEQNASGSTGNPQKPIQKVAQKAVKKPTQKADQKIDQEATQKPVQEATQKPVQEATQKPIQKVAQKAVKLRRYASVIPKVLSEYVFYLLFWSFSAATYLFFSLYGFDEIYQGQQDILFGYSVWSLLITFLVGAFVSTTLIFSTNQIINKLTVESNIRFTSLVLLKTLCGIVVVFVIVIATSFVIAEGGMSFGDSVRVLVIGNPELYRFAIQGMHFILLFSIVENLYRRKSIDFFGELLGKYAKPRLSPYIFVNIDLNSFTAVNESVGDENIALLLNDCFVLFDKAVTKYGGTIYNYIGDSVIGCWKAKKRSYGRYLAALYDFFDQLNAKQAYFASRFRVHPTFKVGCSVGTVSLFAINTRNTNVMSFLGEAVNQSVWLHTCAHNGDTATTNTICIPKSLHDASDARMQEMFAVRSIGTVHYKESVKPEEVFLYTMYSQ